MTTPISHKTVNKRKIYISHKELYKNTLLIPVFFAVVNTKHKNRQTYQEDV